MSAVPAELLGKQLAAAGARISLEESGRRLSAVAATEALERCAAIVRDAGLYPVFMTALHTDPAFELRYQFAAAERNFRVMLSTHADNANHAPSLTPLFPGLQWHERETRDMFGIVFDNHPDLRPLLICEEDRDLHPLRKNAASLKTPEQLGLSAPAGAGGEAP